MCDSFLSCPEPLAPYVLMLGRFRGPCTTSCWVVPETTETNILSKPSPPKVVFYKYSHLKTTWTSALFFCPGRSVIFSASLVTVLAFIYILRIKDPIPQRRNISPTLWFYNLNTATLGTHDFQKPGGNNHPSWRQHTNIGETTFRRKELSGRKLAIGRIIFLF